MNNEPVAWMLADKESEYIRSIMAVQHDFVPEGCVEIPLYTHPAKPLSKVVVASATCSCGKVMEVTNLQEAKTLTDEEILDVEKRLRNNGDFCELHFARAILRKAQGK